MQAFHNDESIKQKYLARVTAHQLADEIVKGKYWENGKGCAVGCTIHSDVHKNYEIELGIPTWLAKVQDRLFEGMPNADAKLFPVQFIAAINVGSDLNRIKAPFLIYVLESAKKNFDHSKYQNVLLSIDRVIDLYRNLLPSNTYAAAAAAISAAARATAYDAAACAAHAADAAACVADAAHAAYDVARAAAYAADAAACAAHAAYAAACAAYDDADAAHAAACVADAARAAYAAACAAAHAADAAAYAADSAYAAACAARAAYAAAASAAYDDADADSKQSKYKEFADELLRLIKECK